MNSRAPKDFARFEELLREYGSRVRALVVSHGLNQHGVDPDDAEQEIHIRLWRAVERDRNGVFHASYIQRIVLSVVVDCIRRAKVRATEPLPGEEEPALALVEPMVGPEQKARGEQYLKAVEQCMAEVPRGRRVALALHLQGYTWEEIAAACGVSAEAARKLTTRGMAQLTTRLAELGYSEFDYEN